MKEVLVKKIELENYKNFSGISLPMFARSKVSGRNRVGKTTLMDGYFDTITGNMASGKEPDEIRRKENGQEIPKVDVVRRVVLDIDGKEHTIQKTTRQKWKKPRGKTEEVFSGNETKIEVDNYSVSNRAFTEWISENITTPDTLLMCSNPVPFLNILQKNTNEARKLLERLSGFKIEEFIAQNPQYTDIAELLEGHKVEDVLSKFRKQLNEQKKKVAAKNTEIKYEQGRELVKVDVDSLRKQKEEAEKQLEELKDKETRLNNALEVSDKLNSEILELQKSRQDIVSGEENKLIAKRMAVREELNGFEKCKTNFETEKKAVESRMEELKQEIESTQKTLEKARKDYVEVRKQEFDESELKRIEAEEFDENSCICPTCGQEFPDEMKEKARGKWESSKKSRIDTQKMLEQKFESDKKENLSRITLAGNKAAANLKSFKKEFSKLEGKVPKLDEAIENSKKEIKATQKELDAIPPHANLTGNDEVISIDDQIDSKKKALFEMSKTDARKEIAETKEITIESIALFKGQIEASEKAQKDRKNQLDTLNAELRELSQVEANLEQKIDSVLNFSIEKNKALADEINQYFNHFEFEFLKYTIEGNPVETCKMVVDGINYFKGVNHGDRILCEIDLVKGLQKMNGLNIPIFVDDSESLDSDRVPDIEGQLILLERNDNTTLSVIEF